MPRLSISAATPTHATLNGRQVLSFGGCNYLGLAHHPGVHAALIDGLQTFGLSTSASRETTGNTTAHDALEAALCRFLSFPSGTVVPDGYTANLAIAQALAPTHPIGLIDRRSHKSIREAVAVAGMTLVEYDHLDAAHAAELLNHHRSTGRGVALFTDGIFTADGALAPIPDLLRACTPGMSPVSGPNPADAALPDPASIEPKPRTSAPQAPPTTLIVDDCHGFCTVGPRGRGAISHFNINPENHPNLALTTTLAKGLGCHGGIVAGHPWLAELVRGRASAYICTTPVSPAIAAAATEAVNILIHEPDRVRRLQRNAAKLRGALSSSPLHLLTSPPPHLLPSPAPIFAFTLPSEATMRRLYAALLEEGILAPLISYPGGPAPAYFRLSVSSEHTDAHLDRLITSLAKHLESLTATPSRAAG